MQRYAFFAGLLLTAGTVAADEVWFATHNYCGSATANVFDGGPPLSESGCTSVLGGFAEVFSVVDITQPGSLGALASATTESTVFPYDDILTMSVSLRAAYTPSTQPGGDNPGGMAAAEVSSVIEFRMPTDELGWTYNLLIDSDPGYFEGATLVTVENVTRSQTLLTLTESANPVPTILAGHAGDLIRISANASGEGSMGPGSGKEYVSWLSMGFSVPEPGTFMLVICIMTLASMRRHRLESGAIGR